MSPDAESPRLPSLGAVGWARWAWRQLTSMRTALLLLLLLAVAAVPGSVFPQRRINPGAVLDYLDAYPDVGPWLDRFGFFDVYTSVWFSAIYLLLFVSLVGCVLPRSRHHLRAVRAAPPRTPMRLARMQGHRQVIVDAPAEHVLQAGRAHLRRRRYRVAEYDGGESLSAERGYLAETGNLVFHLALLGLLVAVATGSVWGFSGQVLVVEGQGFANAVPNYDTFQAGPRVDRGTLQPFSFTLDSLDVTYETQVRGRQLGEPRSFDARLTVRDTPDAAPRQVVVRPNQPLDVDGTRAFLVGNGYAALMTVRDGEGRVAFRDVVPFLPQDGQYSSIGVVKVPDAAPRQIGLIGSLLPTAAIDPASGPISIFPDARRPRLVLTAYVSRPGQDDIGVNSGVPQSVYRLNTSRMVQLRGEDGGPLRLLLAPGTSTMLPDGAGSVSFDELRRFAAFDLRRDPSKGWALVTSGLALVAITASLFVRRRRLWLRVSSDARGRTVVEAAGLSRNEDAGIGEEVAALVAAVAPASPAPDAPQTPLVNSTHTLGKE